MIYIHKITTVSPQHELVPSSIDELKLSERNVMKVVEPKYEGIPLSILRRMGKAVRMGVGAALPLIKEGEQPLNGIVIGTANGGMEDCIKFLNQVIEYEEGTLTPTNFVQSTPNAIASQLSLLSMNKGYNITHVNRGLAFENALLDVWMLLRENPDHSYLLGGVEEISSYNYNIDYLADWFKKVETSNLELFESGTEGTLSGEGSAMFIVNASPKGAISKVESLDLCYTSEIAELVTQLRKFLDESLKPGDSIDILLSGENGDSRSLHFFTAVEQAVSEASVARYKHITGDFATASALSLGIACDLIQKNTLPHYMIKKDSGKNQSGRILLYNHHKGVQHSFILVSKV